MAKSSKSKRSSPGQRVASVNASPSIPDRTHGLLVPVAPRPLRFLPPVLQIEDRRSFHFSPVRPAAALRRPAARLVARQPYRQWQPAQTRAVVAFQEPRLVSICERRRRRRETLFALKRTKKGAGSPRRRNAFSDISCR